MIEPHGPAIASLLGRLHSCPAEGGEGGCERRGSFWADMAAWAANLPEAWGDAHAPGRAELLAEVAWLRGGAGARLSASPDVLLHKDVHGGNLLRVESGELRLIDLEFADVGPRAFDVANFFLECAFVEEDESWDWGRVPTSSQQLEFAAAYARALAAGSGGRATDEQAVAATAQALLAEWRGGWGLVAHLWNILWALTTAVAADGSVGDDFDYRAYAATRYARYLHEKQAL